jgi:hypothetical protein
MPPHNDHTALAVASACVVLGLAVLAAALFVLPKASGQGDPAPAPPVQLAAPALVPSPAAPPPAGTAPAPASAPQTAKTKAAAARDALTSARGAWEKLFAHNAVAHVPADWVAGYYPLYETAQRTFGVNWLLLASIHRQETAFSTASTTYHGLNFVHCCAGPMQFNVTNGPTTTWELVRSAYRQSERPTDYPHRTAHHPSVYDDYDAMMAAGRLLRSSGAAAALDGAAWRAAYDYYGHDSVGVEYADQVLARAIGWSQKGFSINQTVDQSLLAAVHAAWGAPVEDELARIEQARERAQRRHRRSHDAAADARRGRQARR